MHDLNQNIFLWINNFVGKSNILDSIMISAAQYMPYLFILLLFYLWFTNRKNEALYAGYTTTLGVGINLLIGLFYFHNRPFMDHLGTTLLSHKADSSFPSDHTTFTSSIALMLLTFKSTRLIGIVATLLALWCGISRVYAGVHYPFDIVGSIIISMIAVFMIILFKDKLLILNQFLISVWNKSTRSRQ
jgi:undecaprenyl-diphosphatase